MDHAHHQLYTCPMHPEVIKNAPGKYPKCGVDLVPISEKENEQHGHQQHSNPRDVANLILFGKATYRKMIQNLGWATGYNVIALPLAACILYNAGINNA